MVEVAKRRHRHEIHIDVESSILFPKLDDITVGEFEQNLRDSFFLQPYSFYGPKYDHSVIWWPLYEVATVKKRVIRMWKMVSTIVRKQSIDNLPINKITKYFKMVSFNSFHFFGLKS